MLAITCTRALRTLTPPPLARQESPISLDGLRMLLSRETAQDPPQTWIMTFSRGADGPLTSTERQLTDYPHPHPQLRDLQKEVGAWARSCARSR